MEEKKKFQGKKLNRKENEAVKKIAKCVKGGFGFLMTFAVVGSGIKKYGKYVLKFGKDIISKS